jgi:hypothetical protein
MSEPIPAIVWNYKYTVWITELTFRRQIIRATIRPTVDGRGAFFWQVSTTEQGGTYTKIVGTGRGKEIEGAKAEAQRMIRREIANTPQQGRLARLARRLRP